MQRVKTEKSTALETKEPLTKSAHNEPGLQDKIDEIDMIVIHLKNNPADGPTNFAEEAGRIKKVLVVLPRGTLDALKSIL
jgi:hypothetical protein